MTQTRHYEASNYHTEAFPPDCARWTIAADAVSAHNRVTRAELNFLGLDSAGLVFLTNRGPQMKSDPGDDLKPLKFEYKSPDLSFEFSVFRQIVLEISYRHDSYTRCLFWKLDLNRITFCKSDGAQVHAKGLGRLAFEDVADDLIDVLRMWPDEPDEIGKVPSRPNRVIPLNRLIVTGGWLGNKWSPLFFRSFTSIDGLFFRSGLRTQRTREFQAQPSPWQRDSDDENRIYNVATGDSLRYEGEVPYVKVNPEDPERTFQHFILRVGGQEVSLPIKFDISGRREGKAWEDQVWTVSLFDAAPLTTGFATGINGYLGLTEGEQAQVFDRWTPKISKLVEIIGVDAMLHWPGSTETGPMLPVLIRVWGAPWNGCQNFAKSFQAGHNISHYGLFEYTHRKKLP